MKYFSSYKINTPDFLVATYRKFELKNPMLNNEHWVLKLRCIRLIKSELLYSLI
jgi:hypothetical protein